MNNDTGIYTISSPSGRLYVGSASSFKRRWAKHLTDLRKGVHHSPALQRAYAKYGESALKFQKVALCPIYDLLIVEQEFIDRLRPEYNVCRKAGSTIGLKLGPFSQEHRDKIGRAHKGKKLSIEQCQKIGETHKGKTLSQRHRSILRECSSGASNPFFGKKHTKETLDRVSGWNHHSSVPVVCVETGQVFPSFEAATKWLREHGKPSASKSPIRDCCRGSTRYSKPYGYTWRFAPSP